MIKQLRLGSKVYGSKITNRDSPMLEIYFSEIKNNKPLSMQEEQELIRRFKSGDRNAANKLIKANLKFVVSVAKSYYSGRTPLCDLISEGNIGLFKALEKYDETRNLKFISYAVWWIRQSIMQYMGEKERIIKLPGNKNQNLIKIKNFVDLYFKENGIMPSDSTVYESLLMTKDEYLSTTQSSLVTSSLHQPIDLGQGDSVNLEDVIESDFFELPDSFLNKKDIQNNVQKLLSRLDSRDADILTAHFQLLDIDGNRLKTIEQVIDEHKISETRINQLKHEILRKIRCRFGVKKLQLLLS